MWVTAPFEVIVATPGSLVGSFRNVSMNAGRRSAKGDSRIVEKCLLFLFLLFSPG